MQKRNERENIKINRMNVKKITLNIVDGVIGHVKDEGVTEGKPDRTKNEGKNDGIDKEQNPERKIEITEKKIDIVKMPLNRIVPIPIRKGKRERRKGKKEDVFLSVMFQKSKHYRIVKNSLQYIKKLSIQKNILCC